MRVSTWRRSWTIHACGVGCYACVNALQTSGCGGHALWPFGPLPFGPSARGPRPLGALVLYLGVSGLRGIIIGTGHFDNDAFFCKNVILFENAFFSIFLWKMRKISKICKIFIFFQNLACLALCLARARPSAEELPRTAEDCRGGSGSSAEELPRTAEDCRGASQVRPQAKFCKKLKILQILNFFSDFSMKNFKKLHCHDFQSKSLFC